MAVGIDGHFITVKITTNIVNKKDVANSSKLLFTIYMSGTGDKDNISLSEKKEFDVNCSDGSSISFVNWCDKNFDCLDYTDELSCLNKIKDHNLSKHTTTDTMINSDLPRRHNSGAYFRCKHSREWISMLAKCDDIIDCLDASDEVRCLHDNIECNEDEFSCDNGNCIKLSRVCDFKPDCVDGKDELCDYPTCDDETEFRCENRQCIPAVNRCNAEYDCFDKSDETDCDFCEESFLCAADYKCILHRLTCDRYPDCRDGGDEVFCQSNSPTSDDFSSKYLSSNGIITGTIVKII
ncbi:very low-density lipoprotein receptor-like [Ruditapes philippinarum]|uniref:very low-density lipoprotein receptor-like n=1 Tax=Ruditapes philippinarum TaxID=129788 RepID=UPI00295C2E54|nr:very low-density lipoprotein receptor-like [Ruditapes philippinarum]